MVTIIMPAYNAGGYIGESIQSVLSQSLMDWELIVVNDGSTDETRAFLDQVDDSRIRVIHQKNRGVSAARNAALDFARGEFITFLDADDVLPQRSLEIRATYLRAHPDVDIVDGGLSVRDESLEKERRSYRPYYRGELLPRLLKLDDRVFGGPFYMFRRASLANTRFDVTMTHSEDLLFFMEIARSSKMRYGCVNEVVYHYRTGHGSAMANLEGLERGYLQLLARVGTFPEVTVADMVYLRVKIAKILFLSWRARGEWNKAINGAVCALKGIGGAT